MKIKRKEFNWRIPGNTAVAKNNVAVFGGTSGIGRSIATNLAKYGDNVTVYGRTFRDQGLPNLDFEKADLTQMKNAKALSSKVPAENIDLLIFTNGIMTTPAKIETAEKLEIDLAVSFLSRLAILDEIAPLLGKNRHGKCKVFIMGYPGSGQKLPDPSDLNSEKVYKQFPAHMKTVVGNEALVLESAKRYKNLNVFGLNPGLIKTGIRSNVLGKGTFKQKLVEGIIGLANPSADQFAQSLIPLFYSPDLNNVSGFHFNQKAQAIEPSSNLTEAYVEKIMAASRALIDKAINISDKDVKSP